jgi:hypothetical protein
MLDTFSAHSASSKNAIDPQLQEAIRGRAEEIYIRSGSIPGRDLQNWAQAEAEILRECEESLRQAAIVVEVGGVQYVGEYDSASSHGYSTGEFGSGDDVALRFEGDKMFVRRPNGMELETTIVRKIG